MGQWSFQVAGVDGCRAGWFVVIVSVVKKGSGTKAHCLFRLKDFLLARNFSEVLRQTAGCKLVCVDIPIGLSDSQPRQCDIEARRILGRGRASSIFPPPVRPCLLATEPETASEISFKHSGKRLNRQSFLILSKIREVDKAMTSQLQQRVREIHPELVFWALNGKKPMQHKKRQLVGRNERIKLLAGIFGDVTMLVAKARKAREVAPDDILDALAAAWTASQAVIGKAQTLPKNPELDSRGLRMEILCPAAII